MVYDWEGKREICYQMYIKDKKALEEIMEYMRNVYQFSPRYAHSPLSQCSSSPILENARFELRFSSTFG
jgi:hypothetical protein